MSRSFKQPWVKGSQPKNKRAQSRNYRRFIRQALKPWRFKFWWHTDEKYCGFCECYEDGMCWYMWQPEEPGFPPPHKFNDPIDVFDWRYRVKDQKYIRK